jgi:hypothetical protein
LRAAIGVRDVRKEIAIVSIAGSILQSGEFVADGVSCPMISSAKKGAKPDTGILRHRPVSTDPKEYSPIG